jgi:hypothetical protein
LYRYNPEGKTFARVETFPQEFRPSVLAERTEDLWSPEGDKLLGHYYLKGERRSKWAVCNLTNGATEILPEDVDGAVWEDDGTIRFVSEESPEFAGPEPPPGRPVTVGISLLDPGSGEIHTLSENVFHPDGYVRFFPGLEYAIVTGEETEGDDMLRGDMVESTLLCNLESGATAELGPARSGVSGIMRAWDRDLERLAYVKVTPAGYRLVLLDAAQGKEISSHGFGEDDFLSSLRMSPDGTMVSYLRARYAATERVPVPCGRHEIWDSRTDTTVPIRSVGFAELLLNGIVGETPGTFPQWTPDGESLLLTKMVSRGDSVSMNLESVDVAGSLSE